MAFTNATDLAATDIPYVDAEGRDVVIAVVKGTFEIDARGRVQRAEEPSEVRLADVPYDPDAALGSVRYPNDVCTEKRGTDVVVVGEAVSRAPVTVLDVAVRVRELSAPLRVHGERLFYRSITGVKIGPAAPFERKAIVYEKAYGGASSDWGVVEERNPAGVGVAARTSDLVDRPAPQIEHPLRPHLSASDQHAPAGYGAILPHWSPRKEHAGTFDKAWKETRMPMMPLDFDVRYHNFAHPSLQIPEHLVAGDKVAILGMRLEGLFQFDLPRLGVVVHGLFDEGKVTVRPPVDTLLIEPSRSRFEIVVRAAFPMGRGKNVLREIRVDTDDG